MGQETVTVRAGAPRAIADADMREGERLHALDRFDALDTPQDAAFDRITNLIRDIFGVRIGIVSLIDGHRQWYKSAVGLPNSEAERKDTFCRHALEHQGPTIIADALQDERFADHPAVTGHPHVRFYAAVPLRTSDGHAIGTVCAIDSEPRQFTEHEARILADLARIAMDEFELRRKVSTDSLTGLASRPAFKEQAAREVALAIRHKYPLSCLMLDLDHFKSINDTHGHAAGDEVLVSVARTCRETLRPTDIFGRLGGEEFGIILSHSNGRAAMVAAEKLRRAIERTEVDLGSSKRTVTASIGVAALNDQIQDIDALLATADAALYKAKGAGRNRCHRSADAAEEARRRVLKAGRIVFNGRKSTIDCTVRTLSETGAGIDVMNARGLPADFNLLIPSDGFEAVCRVASQTDRHLELVFA